MKNGICPKCGAASVYAKDSGVAYGTFEKVQLDAGGWARKLSKVTSYVCVACGYFENCMTNTELLASLTSNTGWTQIAPRATPPVTPPAITI